MGKRMSPLTVRWKGERARVITLDERMYGDASKTATAARNARLPDAPAYAMLHVRRTKEAAAERRAARGDTRALELIMGTVGPTPPAKVKRWRPRKRRRFGQS